MSLQQFAEEPAPVYTAAAQTGTETPPILDAAPLSDSASVENAPRYDAATVQKIIALAEQMQTQHRETLTASDIENLGREVGVEPEFVRRALAKTEQAQMQPIPVASGTGRANRRREISRRPLTRHQRRKAILPAALYSLLMVLTLGLVSSSHDFNLHMILYVALPAFLAFCVGTTTKSLRVSLLSGALLGTAGLTAFSAVSAFNYEFLRELGLFFFFLGMWVGGCVILGMVGTVLRSLFSSQGGHRLRAILGAETDNETDGGAGEQAGEWV